MPLLALLALHSANGFQLAPVPSRAGAVFSSPCMAIDAFTGSMAMDGCVVAGEALPLLR